MAVLQNFHDFQVFIFGYRAQNKKPEITENLYFGVYKAQMNVDLFFNHYFNFQSVETDITKRDQINMARGVKYFQKTQIPATSLAMWLNDFEFDVI